MTLKTIRNNILVDLPHIVGVNQQYVLIYPNTYLSNGGKLQLCSFPALTLPVFFTSAQFLFCLFQHNLNSISCTVFFNSHHLLYIKSYHICKKPPKRPPSKSIGSFVFIRTTICLMKQLFYTIVTFYRTWIFLEV